MIRILRRLGRAIHGSAPLLAAAVIVFVSLFFSLRGQGPLGRVAFFRQLGGLDPSGHDEGSPGPSTTTSTALALSTPSTSARFGLTGINYDPGSCITWDQSEGPVDDRATEEVPCDEEHLFEVTSRVDLDRSAYAEQGPTDDQWRQISLTDCLDRATQFLGYQLDVHGRFVPTLISPWPEAWRSGQHWAWCGMSGVKLAPSDHPQDSEPFIGKVEGADQTLLWGPGTCLGPHDTPAYWRKVSCSEPHDSEVVGTAIVGDASTPYPSTDAIATLSDGACQTAAHAVYGGPLGTGVGYGSLGIDESSWMIGRRVVECVIGLIGPNKSWMASSTLVRR